MWSASYPTPEMRCRGSVAAYVRHLQSGSLVAADVGLRELTRYLQEEPFLLVLEGRTISGLVTATDLGRPAARPTIDLLLAQLEIALADVVRHRFPDQRRAVVLLSEGRQTRHAELISELRDADEFIDDVAALSLKGFSPWSVKRRTSRVTSQATGSGGTSFAVWACSGNDVMHPVRDFHEASTEAYGS